MRPPLSRLAAGLRAALFLVTASTLAGIANADNYYWTGKNAANPNLWTATTGLGGSNWSFSPDFINGTPGVPGSADDVFFYFNPPPNPSSLPNILLGADFSIRSLNFTADSTLPVTINAGNTLTLGTGGLSVFQGAAAHTINVNTVLGAAQEGYVAGSLGQFL